MKKSNKFLEMLIWIIIALMALGFTIYERATRSDDSENNLKGEITNASSISCIV